MRFSRNKHSNWIITRVICYFFCVNVLRLYKICVLLDTGKDYSLFACWFTKDCPWIIIRNKNSWLLLNTYYRLSMESNGMKTDGDFFFHIRTSFCHHLKWKCVLFYDISLKFEKSYCSLLVFIFYCEFNTERTPMSLSISMM